MSYKILFVEYKHMEFGNIKIIMLLKNVRQNSVIQRCWWVFPPTGCRQSLESDRGQTGCTAAGGPGRQTGTAGTLQVINCG